MKKWKELSRKKISKQYLWQHDKIHYKSPNTGKESRYDLLVCPDWTNIVAITKDQKAIMVKQFRPGTDDLTLEFPAGAVDAGEDPKDAATRELQEETGSAINEPILIGKTHPNPAFIANTLWCYLCENAAINGSQDLDHSEEIEVLLVPIEEIDQMILEGTITHSLTITSWYFYKMYERKKT